MSNMLGRIQQFIGPTIKGYGKQIGKTSKSGLNCYSKTLKDGKKYTLVDSKTGQLVRTKLIHGDKKSYMDISTFDNKSNLLQYATIYYEPVGLGLGSHNQFAKKARVIHQDFNKFGQVTNYHDATFTPNSTTTKANVFINHNGQLSKTYINTLDGTKRTITCVE